MARVIVPMSPKDVDEKMLAIFKHQSQKDGAMFLGDDKREFWERAKDRNRHTALTLNKLGFSEYEACECFVNLNDLKNYDEI
jgi:glucosamine-6-phosphate deaminase